MTRQSTVYYLHLLSEGSTRHYTSCVCANTCVVIVPLLSRVFHFLLGFLFFLIITVI